MKRIATPKAPPHGSLAQRAGTGNAARFDPCNRDPSSRKFQIRLAGRSNTGALAAVCFVLVVVCALVFYLLKHDPSSTARANANPAPTNSGVEVQVQAETPPSHAAADPNAVSDSSNRERIIPGSNLSPPTVDYSHSPVDAGQRSRGNGSYGSDMSGGGSPGPN